MTAPTRNPRSAPAPRGASSRRLLVHNASIEQSTRYHFQPARLHQPIDGRARFRRCAMAMDLPERPEVAHEALALLRIEPPPQLRRPRSQRVDYLPPVAVSTQLPDVPSNGAGVARRGPLGVDVRRAMSRLRRRHSRIVAAWQQAPPRDRDDTGNSVRPQPQRHVERRQPSADQQDRCGGIKRFECTSRPRIADVIAASRGTRS